jgi:O-antigen/teichoic acid export membrane protein
VLGLGAVWGVCLGGLALTVTVVCWPWMARACHLDDALQARRAILLLLAGLLLESLSMPWRSALEGTQHYATIAGITAGSSLIGAGLAVGVVEFGGGLGQLGASVVVTSGLRALMFVRSARRVAHWLGPSLKDIRRSDVAYVVSYGSRIQVTNAAAAINTEMDRLVTAGSFGPSEAAGFDLGYRLVGLLLVCSGIVGTAAFPGAVAAAGEPGPIDRLYLALTRYLAVFAATGAALLMVSADSLVRLWLGHPASATVRTVVILAPGYAVAVISGAAAVVTRAEGRPGPETCSGVLAAVLNVALTFPLLWLLGPAGVPVSTTLAILGATMYFFVRFHRASGRPGTPLLRALCPPALAALAAGTVTRVIALGLPTGTDRFGAAVAVTWQSALTILITALLLASAGFFDSSDRSRLLTVATKLAPRRVTFPAVYGRS